MACDQTERTVHPQVVVAMESPTKQFWESFLISDRNATQDDGEDQAESYINGFMTMGTASTESDMVVMQSDNTPEPQPIGGSSVPTLPSSRNAAEDDIAEVLGAMRESRRSGEFLESERLQPSPRKSFEKTAGMIALMMSPLKRASPDRFDLNDFHSEDTSVITNRNRRSTIDTNDGFGSGELEEESILRSAVESLKRNSSVADSSKRFQEAEQLRSSLKVLDDSPQQKEARQFMEKLKEFEVKNEVERRASFNLLLSAEFPNALFVSPEVPEAPPAEIFEEHFPVPPAERPTKHQHAPAAATTTATSVSISADAPTINTFPDRTVTTSTSTSASNSAPDTTNATPTSTTSKSVFGSPHLPSKAAQMRVSAQRQVSDLSVASESPPTAQQQPRFSPTALASASGRSGSGSAASRDVGSAAAGGVSSSGSGRSSGSGSGSGSGGGGGGGGGGLTVVARVRPFTPSEREALSPRVVSYNNNKLIIVNPTSFDADPDAIASAAAAVQAKEWAQVRWRYSLLLWRYLLWRCAAVQHNCSAQLFMVHPIVYFVSHTLCYILCYVCHTYSVLCHTYLVLYPVLHLISYIISESVAPSLHHNAPTVGLPIRPRPVVPRPIRPCPTHQPSRRARSHRDGHRPQAAVRRVLLVLRLRAHRGGQDVHPVRSAGLALGVEGV